MDWRRGTPCLSARCWTCTAGSYHLRRRRTPSSRRSLSKSQSSVGKMWAAASSTAAFPLSTRSHFAAAGSRSHFQGSAGSVRACLPPLMPRPGPTWDWSPPLLPSSVGLTGSSVSPGYWRIGRSACCGSYTGSWCHTQRPQFCPWRCEYSGVPCQYQILMETDLQGKRN